MSQSPQAYFKLILLTVVEKAFAAAGYQLEDRPVQWAGGQFRFSKPLTDGLYAFIEFQVLAYAEGAPSRFRVTLARSDQPNAAQPSHHPRYVRKSLSELVVSDFGVAILPSADHWWTYQNVTELGKGLAEAGHLIVGYGMPYLSGDLEPPG
jgi:hypothetical protein